MKTYYNGRKKHVYPKTRKRVYPKLKCECGERSCKTCYHREYWRRTNK